ncbi:heavy metal translocating P-type ATPase [Affinibrenneria salicis]|uniref:P-type Zn(2+) transporter n=1 Tax=Affinibrenneria salicis TaxID=2590031 RepID=A0A5J5G068_9GAMM|nr:heavy metal translocating P-type ATPase [Affinibrenneria salicis]KAA8998961.1 heavy metal translocating P-type ATPase [Affinibrenneria salicis]
MTTSSKKFSFSKPPIQPLAPDNPAPVGHAPNNHGRADCCAPEVKTAPLPLPPPENTPEGVRSAIRIQQMDCPVEEAVLRTALGALPGVRRMEFNLLQRVLTVTHDGDALPAILAAIRTSGFEPETADGDRTAGATRVWRTWLTFGSAALAAIGAEVTHFAGLPAAVPAVLALIAIAVCGLSTYKKGWIAVRQGNLNINALMSIAVTGAIVLGQWPEAAMVMVLFTLAEAIEAKSLDRARQAISGLMALTPDTASVKQPDGRWLEVDAREVAPGSVARVRPGERIALDGEILSGYSSINQSPITGESLPVDKAAGDAIFAGTINLSGTLEYRVSAAATRSTLARIIQAVEQAQVARAPMQRFIDRFARIYTPAVLVIALAVAALPPLLLDGDWRTWIYKALVLLVIACPCALVISTPVTIVSGLTSAARRGILIKGGAYLEKGRKLTSLALDKTGTLTSGKPRQTDAIILPGIDAGRACQLARSLAGASDHPVSQAIAQAPDNQSRPALPVAALQAHVGRGVSATIDGERYWLGNRRMAQEATLMTDELAARLTTLEQQGKTAVLLASASRALALFAVADTVKPASLAAIADLQRLGVATVMLTGDNPHAARAIAGQLGIDEVWDSLLPEDKLKQIERLSAHGVTGMAGDGINDAPALARADIGFAMGAMGTDSAIETADVALMDDDLGKIPAFIRLSQRTHRVLLQNIVMALGIKAAFLLLTLAGAGTMWMAVFADTGASLLVIANGLRLLRRPRPDQP